MRMKDIQTGRVYAGKPGTIPRYVLTAGSHVTYLLVKPDEPEFDSASCGKPSCSLHAFEIWASVEIPVNDAVRSQVEKHDTSLIGFIDGLKAMSIKAATDQELILELTQRGYSVKPSAPCKP